MADYVIMNLEMKRAFLSHIRHRHDQHHSHNHLFVTVFDGRCVYVKRIVNNGVW